MNQDSAKRKIQKQFGSEIANWFDSAVHHAEELDAVRGFLPSDSLPHSQPACSAECGCSTGKYTTGESRLDDLGLKTEHFICTPRGRMSVTMPNFVSPQHQAARLAVIVRALNEASK